MAFSIIEASSDTELRAKVAESIDAGQLPFGDWTYTNGRYVVPTYADTPAGAGDFVLVTAPDNVSLASATAQWLGIGYRTFGSTKVIGAQYVQAVVSGLPAQVLPDVIYSTSIVDTTPTGRALMTTPDASSGRTVLGATSTGSALFTAADGPGALAALTPSMIGAALFYAPDSTSAQSDLGATVTGSALFTAASASDARTVLGAGATGSLLFAAPTAAAARTTLGAGTTGSAVFAAATPGAARTTLGATTLGDALFTTSDAGAARTSLGAGPTGSALFGANNNTIARSTLGSKATGDALFVAASPSEAHAVLGAGTAGLSVYQYATVAEIQTFLGITSGGAITADSITDATATGKSLLRAADASTALTVLGASSIGSSLFTAPSTASARTTLGVSTIGSNLMSASNTTNALNAIGLAGMSSLSSNQFNVGIGAATAYIKLGQAGSTGGMISGGDKSIKLGTGTSALYRTTLAITDEIVQSFKNVVPGQDNTVSLGTAALGWTQVYATSAVITPSDERLKTDVMPIPDVVLDVWSTINYVRYRFHEGVRIHVGVIAQRVKEAFEAAGLDPFAYGILCYDEWEEVAAETDSSGREVRAAVPAGNRYAIRYEEALILEAALMRRELRRLQEA